MALKVLHNWWVRTSGYRKTVCNVNGRIMSVERLYIDDADSMVPLPDRSTQFQYYVEFFCREDNVWKEVLSWQTVEVRWIEDHLWLESVEEEIRNAIVILDGE